MMLKFWNYQVYFVISKIAARSYSQWASTSYIIHVLLAYTWLQLHLPFFLIDDQQLLKKDCDKLAAFEVSREDFLHESEMQVSTTKDTTKKHATKDGITKKQKAATKEMCN